ncbi:hypothetical protein N7491_007296 [Penicillium cf. griseofulvum]|uniref:Metallo-beta-lactamase domain-containing protein n=1 Tax=Penicillium cf. griseofulvum TaxID=2972120 RepID=A0A9W9IU78_9EURO|nr:hypothetical protein N7472_009675 [Penicillium cf. griseofulvum]KAJ5430280.1 hypothetical protein N7491_007296 [Penicillium cf. griseofulvum]KAJ5435950.1 hypothetical protein N7445_006835 [Penicillium cf. griseofulvum]
MTAQSTLPPGFKLWLQLLDLGVLDIDASYVLSGANVPLHGATPQNHECRPCLMIEGLLYHLDKGLILLDMGSREDIIQSWDKEFLECAPPIKATGAGEIGDVKAVVMSHLNLDHAGGLKHFFGTGKPTFTISKNEEIWCHEYELKNAFWASATGIDAGLFLPYYLRTDLLNWKTISENKVELWKGFTVHNCPGHTEGCLVTELTFPISDTVVMTGDLFHVKENYEDGRPQRFLMRDYSQWFQS